MKNDFPDKRIRMLFLTMLVSLIFAAGAEAKVRCSDLKPPLRYNKRTKTCDWNKKAEKPKYERKGNKGCKDDKPAPVDLQKHGLRAANPRVAFMKPEVLNYLVNLKRKCKGLVVQSTFRDCITNLNVGGKQKSRHLCGGAADTSGCPSGNAKAVPSSVCGSSGLTFINEGSKKFPHCQFRCD